jgi:signal transduction histidine kinase
MFEPFHTTKANGTGLGLPIAYQIITSNRGVLELRSAEGMMHAMMRFPAEGLEDGGGRGRGNHPLRALGAGTPPHSPLTNPPAPRR